MITLAGTITKLASTIIGEAVTLKAYIKNTGATTENIYCYCGKAPPIIDPKTDKPLNSYSIQMKTLDPNQETTVHWNFTINLIAHFYFLLGVTLLVDGKATFVISDLKTITIVNIKTIALYTTIASMFIGAIALLVLSTSKKS